MTQVSREAIVALLRNRGDLEAAARAEAEFPETVDEQTHSELLEAFGIDAAELRHARSNPPWRA